MIVNVVEDEALRRAEEGEGMGMPVHREPSLERDGQGRTWLPVEGHPGASVCEVHG